MKIELFDEKTAMGSLPSFDLCLIPPKRKLLDEKTVRVSTVFRPEDIEDEKTVRVSTVFRPEDNEDEREAVTDKEIK